MSVCRACGIAIGLHDHVVEVGESPMHVACAEAGTRPKQRRIGAWAAMGSRGQMLMSELQRDTTVD